MNKALNHPRLLIALGLAALIMSAAAACGNSRAGDSSCRSLCDADFWRNVSLEDVRLELNRGADVNARGGFLGWTPLHWASAEEPAIIELLLDRGANIHIRDYEGETPCQLSNENTALDGTEVLQRLCR